jgi:TonB-linked SusC/RagA family outer membrane protein
MFHNAVQQNYTLSLAGGTDHFHYYWSGGYMNNQGLVVGDRFSTVQSRLKLDADVTSFLTVGINTAFSDRDESSVPLNWGLMTLNSPYGGMWNDDTTDYRYSPQDDQGSGARNPLYSQEYTDRMKKYYTLNSIIFAKVKLPFGITYTANFTPEFEWYQYFNHYSAKDQDYTKLGGTAERDQHQIFQWQLDNIINWNKTFKGQHHFEVTLLANSEKYQYWENDMQTQGFDPSDALGYHNFAAGNSPVITSDDEYSTGAALMARVFYSYKDRYMLTGSVRRDGYSAFGQKYPWADFPALAAGWVFSQEPFLQSWSDWLSFGKLRLSYGVNGNRDIGRYIALSDLTTGKYLEVNPDGTTSVVSQLWVGRMQNSNLKWERTAAFNLGLDFSLFHDIIGGTVEVYKSKTTNLLMNRTLPDIDGFANIETNLGELDNKGLEITIKSRNIDHPNFSWHTTANFSTNRNTIVHLYGDMQDITDSTGKVIGQKEASDITNKWFIGHSIDAVWDARVTGVYQTDQADEAAKFGKKPGDFIVQDVNGDHKITNTDRQFLGYSKPRFRWTLNNDFTIYKNFDLSVSVYSYWGYMASFNQAKNNASFPDRVNSYVYPYWTPEHPENKFSRIYSSDGGASYSVYRNRNFIRLDNIALGYTFPQAMLNRAKIQALKVYFTVKNVAYYAPDWIYWDPDWDPDTGPGPTPRTYTLGLNLTL